MVIRGGLYARGFETKKKRKLQKKAIAVPFTFSVLIKL